MVPSLSNLTVVVSSSETHRCCLFLDKIRCFLKLTFLESVHFTLSTCCRQDVDAVLSNHEYQVNPVINQSVAGIKFDCEGCEYGAFEDIVMHEKKTNTPFNRIYSLSTEFHLSITLGMKYKTDIAKIYYVGAFLESQKCRTVHFAKNRGSWRDWKMNEYLKANGFKEGNCCHEYSFSCNEQS